MTEQHPIIPPLELVKLWEEDWHNSHLEKGWHDLKVKHKEFGPYMAECGAQWGADQELEECRLEIIDGAGLFLLGDTTDRVELANELRNSRRPKPPSLKEQALEEIGAFEGMGTCNIDIIRRALEALPDD